MKNRLKWMLVLAAMLCMVCGWTMAESTPEVQIPTAQEIRDRFYFPQPPEGLVLDEPIIRDGFIQIVINADKTNFDILPFPQRGLIDFPMMIKAPTDGKTYTKHNCVFYGPEIFTDEGAIGISRVERVDNGNVFPCPIYMMGTMDTERMMFLPRSETAEDNTWHMIRWQTEDGTETFEKLIVRITYSGQLEPVYLPMRYVSEEMLSPMNSWKEDEFFQNVTIKDGELHLQMSESAERKIIPLVLNAPSGAVSAKIEHEYEGDVTEATVNNQQVSFHVEDGGNWRIIDCNNRKMVEDNAYFITWYDGDRHPLYQSQLTIFTIPYENNPLFNYVQSSRYEQMHSIKAIDKDRLTIHNNMSNCGVEWRYDQENGTVQIFREPSSKVTGEPGALIGYVRPEKKDWKYARIVTVGGSAILGAGKIDMAYENLEFFDVQLVGGNGIEVFEEKPLTRYKAGPVQVYLQPNVSPYGGGAILVAWYENENDPWDKPARMEYIHVITEELFVEADGELLPHGTAINAPVEQITVIMPEGYEQKWKDWNLVIRYDPQMGLNALHYEIYGTNETGAFQKIDLDEPVELYMPYPEDKDHNTQDKFYLYHFNAVYQQKEKLLGQKTPYGILYHVSSFSPFVLEWVGEEPVTISQAEPFGAEDITPELKATGLDSVEKIQSKLMAEVLAQGGVLDQKAMFDLKLYVLQPDGTTEKATAANFPESGRMEVEIDLPHGSSADDIFTVVHMFATNNFGKKAGDTESWTLRPVRNADGVYKMRFTITGMSPVMISWQKAEQPSVPQTGDASAIGLWSVMLLVSAACALLLIRRKHA